MAVHLQSHTYSQRRGMRRTRASVTSGDHGLVCLRLVIVQHLVRYPNSLPDITPLESVVVKLPYEPYLILDWMTDASL
jgi:hypothetical protein